MVLIFNMVFVKNVKISLFTKLLLETLLYIYFVWKVSVSVLIKGPFSGLRQFPKPSEIDKKCFFSCLKLFLFLRYSHFCLDFLVIQKKGLIRRLRLISKFMTSQTGQLIITIHMLSDIARTEGNQAMKFVKLLIRQNTIIYPQKSCRK